MAAKKNTIVIEPEIVEPDVMDQIRFKKVYGAKTQKAKKVQTESEWQKLFNSLSESKNGRQDIITRLIRSVEKVPDAWLIRLVENLESKKPSHIKKFITEFESAQNSDNSKSATRKDDGVKSASSERATLCRKMKIELETSLDSLKAVSGPKKLREAKKLLKRTEEFATLFPKSTVAKKLVKRAKYVVTRASKSVVAN